MTIVTPQIAAAIAADVNSMIGSQWFGQRLSYDLTTGEATGNLGAPAGWPGPERGRVVLRVPQPWGGPIAPREAVALTADTVASVAAEQARELEMDAAQDDRERQDAIRRVALYEGEVADAAAGSREHARALNSLESARDALARADR